MTKIRIAVQSGYGKAKLMKVSGALSCLLLLGALLNFSSCDRIKGISGGGIGVNLTTTPVSITDCVPDQDPIKLHKGDIVVWSPQDKDYVIHFEPKNYPGTTTPIPVPNDLQLPKGKQTAQKLDLPYDCSRRGCYFKYDIYEGGTLCNDPGVHIVR